MKVRLRGVFSGQEILDAFKMAAEFEFNKDWGKYWEEGSRVSREKWIVKEIKGETEYEPGSVRRIEFLGASAIRHVFRSAGRFLWWSWQERWNPGHSECLSPTEFHLVPLRLDANYKDVEIKIRSRVSTGANYAAGWWEFKEDKEKFKEEFEKMLSGFYANLNIAKAV